MQISGNERDALVNRDDGHKQTLYTGEITWTYSTTTTKARK